MKKLLRALIFILPVISFAQDVVINNWDMNISIENSENMSISEKKSITILNEEGLRYSVFTNSEDDFSKISELKMILKDRNGKTVKKFGKQAANEYMFNEENEIDDSKLVVLDPEYQSYPFTVEVEYVKKYNKGFLNLPIWLPRAYYKVEVQAASLVVERPQDFELNLYYEGIDEPMKEVSDGKEIWEWRVADLSSIDNDISYNQFFNNQPKVYLSPVDFELDKTEGSFESWETFGEWYLQLNSEPYTFSSDTKNFMDGLPADNVDSLVNQLYRFMQQRSRYISIQLGIGGFKSFSTEYVDERGFGDCKALSNYMRSMLDYKGIKSNYILVNAGSDSPELKKEIISNQFNHVFLAVPNKEDTIYLECTSQMLPTGYIGTFTDDRDVLWIEEGSSQLIRTPVYNHTDNVLTTQAEVKMDKYGNAFVNLTRERKGTFYEDIQYLKSRTSDQTKRYLQSNFDFKDFMLDKYSYQETDKNAPAYTNAYEMRVNNVARNSGNKLLIPVNVFPAIDFYFRHDRFRKFSEVKRAFTLEDEVVIELPEGFNIDRIPTLSPIEELYGSYECRIKDLENGSIQINRKVIIYKGLYMEENFDSFNAFVSQVKKADRSKFVIESGT